MIKTKTLQLGFFLLLTAGALIVSVWSIAQARIYNPNPTGGTVGGSLSGGTANRVLYENSSNQLAESANLTFDGTTLTVSTLSVTNLSTLVGGFVSSGSSTVAANLKVSGLLNASSTLHTSGDVVASSTAGTTTLAVKGTKGGAASCIEMMAIDGSRIRIYATSSPAVGDRSEGIYALRVEAGQCQ